MPQSSRSFFVQGLMILLPVAILTGFGLYSLREDRALADKEASERAAELAPALGEKIWSELCASPGSLFPELSALRGLETNLVYGPVSAFPSQYSMDPIWRFATARKPVHVAVLDERFRLVYPRSAVQSTDSLPLDHDEIRPPQQAMWQSAVAKEFIEQDWDAAIQAYRDLLLTDPPARWQAASHYALGLLLRKEGHAEASEREFIAVARFPDAFCEGGIPFAQLAAWQLPPSPEHAAFLRWTAMRYPTILSSRILGRADSIAPDQEWRAVWELHEGVRGLCADPLFLETLIGSEPLANPRWWPSGTNWIGTLYSRTNSPKGYIMVARSGSELRAIALAAMNLVRLPSYLEPSITLAGRRLVGPRSPARTLASHGSGGFFQLDLVLGHPELLYSHTTHRTLLFGLLIALSGMAAVIGFLSARTAFHRLTRLSEMKSNFVSSVSHELRAPIASVRLMAERLQSGRVEEGRRQEYYRFITQECQRLTSLIENVLNLARFEKGRKTYEFAPANLVELVRNTTRGFEPVAAGRGLMLVASIQENARPSELRIDAVAVQQALGNLIDNAIKHSASGSRITVGLERSALREIQLWVEDQGEGIPREEHRLIFQQFYRVGSELRRKTQGVGIGLSIVKQVADAHKARITLRSAPGQGSRFTLYFPAPNE